jgi:phosphoglycolate phosphatase-like HAD superfamily hydrolase
VTNPALQLLSQCSTVLFDFDGPLCDVFANKPAWKIARHLETLAGDKFSTDDPLEVFRLAFEHDPEHGGVIEDDLIRAEIEAVHLSVPNAVGVAALRSWHAEGKSIGIVSNNSDSAVEIFLDRFRLRSIVSVIVGRAFRHPELMKPHPWPLHEAAARLNSDPLETILIGDSLTDIEAAKRAAMGCVAFANKPWKIQLFEAAGVPTVRSMAEIDPRP